MLEIYWFDQIDSTQLQLIKDLKNKEVLPPVLYATEYQTKGIGSRGNRWIGKRGNLFFSVAISKSSLPEDLPLASASIYFSFLLKDILAQKGSKVWLKWPNDFFIEDKKIGGCITQLVEDILVAGIGINLRFAPKGFERLDISVDPRDIINSYAKKVLQKISWKEIFSKYRLEFQKSKGMLVHLKGRKVSLKNAELSEDGAILIDGERVYSLR